MKAFQSCLLHFNLGEGGGGVAAFQGLSHKKLPEE